MDKCRPVGKECANHSPLEAAYARPKRRPCGVLSSCPFLNSSAKDPSCQTCLLVPFTPPNTLPRCPRGKLERLIHATPVTDHSHHRKAQAASSTIPHDSFLQLPAVISTAALPTHSSLFMASTRTTSRYHGLNGRGLALGSPPDLEIWR